jgi:hypothetical protein
MAGWEKILTDQVTTAEIEDGSITTAKIADNNINGNKLATGAVNHGSKISNDVIDSQHYADGSIDEAHLANDSVSSNKLQDESVVDGKIADNAVTSSTIANGAVTGTQLSTYAINSSAKIGTGVVTTDKLADSAVSNLKLGSGAVRIGNIDTSNSSVLGYYLQASQTTEGLSWVQAPSAHNYMIFKHNFSDNLDTNEHYLPWGSTGENLTAFVDNVRFICPFDNMKFRRFIFQYETLAVYSATITVALKSSSNGSTTLTTQDSVNRTIYASAPYTTQTIDDGTASTQLNYTASLGEALYFSIDFNTDVYNATRDFYATSVWELDGNSIG